MILVHSDRDCLKSVWFPMGGQGTYRLFATRRSKDQMGVGDVTPLSTEHFKAAALRSSRKSPADYMPFSPSCNGVVHASSGHRVERGMEATNKTRRVKGGWQASTDFPAKYRFSGRRRCGGGAGVYQRGPSP